MTEPTTVRIGSGLHARVWDQVAAAFPNAERYGLVVDARVAALWPLPDPAGRELVRCSVPPGEAAKDRSVLGELQDRLLDLRRSEPVVVMGGGAAQDVGGFAAATVRRGVPWVAVATTVVAMADAAVGGKTAVNHPRGKNLLGTFHEPSLVLSDVDYLDTLDARDRTAGLAEVYKCGRIADEALLDRLERGAPEPSDAWIDVLQRAVAVKQALVAQDLRDHGPRRLLNYGHTIGHALERVLGNEAVRHGEAVAIGMHAAAGIAEARGLFDERAEQARTLQALGLPTEKPGIRPDALFDAMALDKKRTPGTTHTFVLPTGRTGAAVFEDVTEHEIRAVL